VGVAMRPAASGSSGLSRDVALREALLACGLLAALVYVGGDILAAMLTDGYSYTSQGIGELMAVEAPTRPLLFVLFTIHNVLVVAFGLAIWATDSTRRAMRVTGALLIVYGLLGFVGFQFPMHVRGAEPAITTTDAAHIAFTVADVLLALLGIGFGAFTHGTRFRLYSMATILVLILFGALAGLQGPQLATGQPTPWLGVTERITVYASMLWLLVLAVVRWRADSGHGQGEPVGLAPAASGKSGVAG
jgi:Protein of unknown function (DUF998)